MNLDALDRLCDHLERELQRDSRGRSVAKLLSDYAESQRDWTSLVRFEPDRYTRNLVYRSATFELLLLCWEAGQASPIHDHASQNCWMTVLAGELEEVLYREAPNGGEAALVEGRRSNLARGQVAYIRDDIGLHLIRPCSGQRGISLHLYSKPIETCRIYDPRTGEATAVQLGYYSVRGERRGPAAEASSARPANSL